MLKMLLIYVADKDCIEHIKFKRCYTFENIFFTSLNLMKVSYYILIRNSTLNGILFSNTFMYV